MLTKLVSSPTRYSTLQLCELNAVEVNARRCDEEFEFLTTSRRGAIISRTENQIVLFNHFHSSKKLFSKLLWHLVHKNKHSDIVLRRALVVNG